MLIALTAAHGVPHTESQCLHGGYRDFVNPTTGKPFHSEYQCLQFLRHPDRRP